MPQLFTPHFYRNFHCVGSDCPEHCCHGWTIPIDKPTYHKYLNHPEGVIREATQQYVRKVKKSAQHWAEAGFDAQGQCGFMDEGGLCNVHKLAGPELLSLTCSTYPRSEARFADQVKRSLKLSCPQACRLILLDPEAMQLKVEPYIGRAISQPVSNKICTLQSACLDLLAQGGTNAEQALFFIGMMVHKAEIQEEAALSEFCAQVLTLARTPNTVFEQLPFLPKIHWLALERLSRPFAHFRSERTARGSAELGHGMDLLHHALEGEFDASRVDCLYDAYFDHVQPFFASHPQVLANYLFYQILDDNFPHSPTLDPITRYQTLVADYFMLRTLLCLKASDKKRLNEDDVIAVFYSYHTRRQHNRQFHDNVTTLLKNAGLAQDIAIYALLVTPPAPDANVKPA